MKLKVSFEVDVPDGATEQQAIEWLRWELGTGSHIDIDNPLDDGDLVAKNVRIM